MTCPALTKAIVYAAAFDAAERSKRDRGIVMIDDEAANAYDREFARLFAAVGGPAGWMELPNA